MFISILINLIAYSIANSCINFYKRRKFEIAGEKINFVIYLFSLC